MTVIKWPKFLYHLYYPCQTAPNHSSSNKRKLSLVMILIFISTFYQINNIQTARSDVQCGGVVKLFLSTSDVDKS